MSFIVSSVDLQLFDSHSVVEECMLKDKYKIIVMINTESNNYRFINPVIAQEVCEILKIKFVKLIKYRIAKGYNGKKESFITHVIYSRIIVEPHSKSLAALIITPFANYPIILGRPGLIKHEVIIDAAAVILRESMMKRKKNYCTHLKALGFSFLSISSKTVSSQKMKSSSMKKLMKIFIRSSKTLKTMLNKENPSALTPIDFDLLKKKRSIGSDLSSASMQSKSKKTSKTKKKRMLNESWRGLIELLKNLIKSKQENIKMVMNITIIDAALFNLLTRRKDVEIFAVSLKDIDFEMTKEQRRGLTSRSGCQRNIMTF